MDRPVACSLDDTAARDRLDAWAATLSSLVTTVEWPSPHEVRFQLRDQPAGAVVDLARLEVACCPFFEFGLEITADGSSLRIQVPADAAPVLRDLAALATR
jgi:hypothetical protein